ncbi:MAG: HlyD family type I secretion periplasmic adaptor subunit [Pseudomonadota bacterium]
MLPVTNSKKHLAVADLDLRIRPLFSVSLIVFVLMLGGFFVWSVLAPINSAVIALGVVKVDSERKTIQHLEGGIVAELFVRDGDRVEAGERLLLLKDSQVSSNLGIIEKRLVSLEARVARLGAERLGQADIEYPSELLARGAEEHVAEVLAGESILFQSRRKALEGEHALLLSTIDQLKAQIDAMELQKKSSLEIRESLIQELKGWEKLNEAGDLAKTPVIRQTRSISHIEGEYAQYEADIAVANQGINEAQLRILQLNKSFQESVESELVALQGELQELYERRMAAQDALRRLELRAPRAGVVVNMDVHTIGGVIAPGQAILDIVPEQDDLVLEANVNPQYVDDVTIGLDARVRLTALDARTTPSLNARVENVSADRLVNEQTGEEYYGVRARIFAGELDKLGDKKLLPGMPVEVYIITGERNFLSYLLRPFTDSLNRAFREV